MELVYLWVENYKNIQQQGFNFSPRFDCKYDEDSNELTIDTNDDYIPDFFGENINITAIVGKNGSGKSSVLEFLLDRLANRHEVFLKKFILLYFYEDKLYKYSNFEYTISEKVTIEDYPNVENLLEYYPDLIAVHINSEYKDIEIRDSQQLFSENNKYDKKSSNLAFVENYVNNHEQLAKIEEKFFNPEVLKISIKTRDYYRSALYDDRDYYSDEDWKSVESLIKSLEEKTFVDRLRIIKEIFDLKYSKHKNQGDFIFFISGREDPYKYKFDPELLESIPDIFTQGIDGKLTIKIKDINESILSFIRKLPYVFEIDIYAKNNISFDSLSFGEKQLLTQLHYILVHTSARTYQKYIPPHTNGNGEDIDDYYEDNNIKNVLIFLDEFEIGLHPSWQKKTIKYIVDFLSSLDIKIHILLTSHSPFLLSDIPKQNIIFLDTDEEGKCKVVDGLKKKKETFGANIHSILSDSFFMENGLMGEFAKAKIEDVINYLNNKEFNINNNEKAQKLIDIIGEPIIKNQLQKMLDSKRLTRIDEIDSIKTEISNLKKRLKEIADAKNKS